LVIILWDVVSREPIGKLLTENANGITCVAFSPNGESLASGTWDGTIIMWDLNPQSWINQSCQIVGRNLTRAEWAKYFLGEEYRKTCQQWELEPEQTPPTQ
jgi:WD40 repeat protein